MTTTSVSVTSTTVSPIARAVADVWSLTKPRIAVMAAIVAAGSWLMAKPAHTTMDVVALVQMAGTLLGISLAVMGAGALNMWLERDVDTLMARTRNRPLAARRLDPWVAVVVGVMLAALSVPVLLVFANALTAAIAMLSLFVYVLIYTPMKRTSVMSLPVGAFPGAAPALMGGTAAAGVLEQNGVMVFLLMFVWQIPHFLAISIYREKEYTAAGHVVAPAGAGMTRTKRWMLATAAAVSSLGVAVWPMRLAGPVYGLVAILLGVWFTSTAVVAQRAGDKQQEDSDARRVFIASLVFQTVMFIALGADVVITRWLR
jgi:heme o synthase